MAPAASSGSTMPIPRKVSLGGHSLNSVGSSHCGSASSNCSSAAPVATHRGHHHATSQNLHHHVTIPPPFLPRPSMKVVTQHHHQRLKQSQQLSQQHQQLLLAAQQPPVNVPQVSCNVKVEPMESSDSGNCSGDSTASGGLTLASATCIGNNYSTLWLWDVFFTAQ